MRHDARGLGELDAERRRRCRHSRGSSCGMTAPAVSASGPSSSAVGSASAQRVARSAALQVQQLSSAIVKADRMLAEMTAENEALRAQLDAAETRHHQELSEVHRKAAQTEAGALEAIREAQSRDAEARLELHELRRVHDAELEIERRAASEAVARAEQAERRRRARAPQRGAHREGRRRVSAQPPRPAHRRQERRARLAPGARACASVPVTPLGGRRGAVRALRGGRRRGWRRGGGAEASGSAIQLAEAARLRCASPSSASAWRARCGGRRLERMRVAGGEDGG